MKNKNNYTTYVIILVLLIILLSIANLSLGSVSISIKNVLSTLMGKSFSKNISVIILNYRLPQVFTAIAIGMGLSVSGLLLQTVFRNPLAGPSVLGISSGASLGVALVFLAGSALGIDILNNSFLLGNLSVITAAFSGALFVLGLIMYISGKIGNIITILIIGIMLGYLVSAIVGVLQYFSGSEELQAFVIWSLGSFAKNSIERSLMLLLTSLAIIFSTFFLSTPLNAMLLGENYAKSVGINIKRYYTLTLFISGMLIALGTAFTGPIAFLGLAVPHIARSWFNTSDHRKLLPATILIGANLALLCNIIARLPGYEISLPINSITSVIGAPIVIWVIIKRSKVKVN